MGHFPAPLTGYEVGRGAWLQADRTQGRHRRGQPVDDDGPSAPSRPQYDPGQSHELGPPTAASASRGPGL